MVPHRWWIDVGDDGTVFASSYFGLVSLNGDSGAVNWISDPNNTYVSSLGLLSTADGIVYAVSDQGVVAMSATSGALLATVDIPSSRDRWITSLVLGADRTLIVTNGNEVLGVGVGSK